MGDGIELGGGRPHRHGLAHPDLAREHTQQGLGDGELDACHRFLEAGPLAQLAGRDGLGEGGVREAEMADPRRSDHDWPSSVDSGSSDREAGRSRKAILPRVCSSWAASTNPR